MSKLLNHTSKKQLAGRISSLSLRNPEEFSLIFLGDSHIGMNKKKSPTCKYHLKNYKSILKSISSTDKGLAAIFHGGDGGNNGNYIKKFATITKEILDNKPYRIPFFAGVGNHEYIHDSILYEYKTHISKKENDVIKLYGKKFGPKVAIIIIDTGRSSSRKCSKINGNTLKVSIDKLRKNTVYKSVINDKSVKLIIDMHIPPRMPIFIESSPSHILCPEAQKHFTNFVKDINPERILAIVTHHNHGFIQPYINSQYYFLKKIPVFLTAQGGNYDSVESTDLHSKYSYYKITLFTNTNVSRDNYKIKNVYRVDVNVSKSKILKEIMIY